MTRFRQGRPSWVELKIVVEGKMRDKAHGFEEKSMPEQFRHEISKETIDLAQKHAAQGIEHGSSVEKLGEAIGAEGGAAAQLGQAIEHHGQAIQQHMAATKESVAELEKNKATEVFIQAVGEHALAIQEHVEATKKFLEVSKSKTKRQH